jgi:hypothetical protein
MAMVSKMPKSSYPHIYWRRRIKRVLIASDRDQKFLQSKALRGGQYKFATGSVAGARNGKLAVKRAIMRSDRGPILGGLPHMEAAENPPRQNGSKLLKGKANLPIMEAAEICHGPVANLYRGIAFWAV